MSPALFVVPEDDARVPPADARGLAVRDGGGGPLDVARLRRFRMLQMAGGDLRAPVGTRIERQPRGPRIDLAGIDVPSLFVRLASMETAERESEHAALRTERDDASGDVRRILHVMAERRLRDLRRRRTMRIGDRAESGIAERRNVEIADGVVRDRMRVFGSELHEEIVWMLRVDDRPAADRFSGLEQFGVLLAHGERFEAEHRAEHELPSAEWPAGHPHDPVCGEQL